MTNGSQPGMLPPMRARRSVVSWSAALALLGVSGCTSGTETGNPSITGALSYTGYSSEPLRYGVREGGELATVERAWFDLQAVTVSQADSCGVAETEAFSVAALGIGDHAAGNHNSTAFEATPGTFCGLTLPFVRVPAGTTAELPTELLGHSILLVGKLADGTPFSILSDAEPSVRLRAAPGGFALSSERKDTLLAFDFATWLRDVDLASAAQVEGEIVVSASSNSALLAAFESHLAQGVALYLDRDADGALDAAPELLAQPE